MESIFDKPPTPRRATPLARPAAPARPAPVPARFILPPRAVAALGPCDATMVHVLADERLVALLEDGGVAAAAARVAARPDTLHAEAASNPAVGELYARLAALAARRCEEEAGRAG